MNGAKSVASSSARDASTTGSSRWLSARARPCPGICFITGATPPAINPSAAARPSTATCARRAAIGAITDDRVQAFRRGVEDRQAIGVDADLSQIVGDKPRAEPGKPLGLRGVGAGQFKTGGCRIGAPMRRTEPLNAAAFLINENWRVAAESAANVGGQTGNLLRRNDIAAKENHAPRRRLAQEGALRLFERAAL